MFSSISVHASRMKKCETDSELATESGKDSRLRDGVTPRELGIPPRGTYQKRPPIGPISSQTGASATPSRPNPVRKAQLWIRTPADAWGLLDKAAAAVPELLLHRSRAELPSGTQRGAVGLPSLQKPNFWRLPRYRNFVRVSKRLLIPYRFCFGFFLTSGIWKEPCLGGPGVVMS